MAFYVNRLLAGDSHEILNLIKVPKIAASFENVVFVNLYPDNSSVQNVCLHVFHVLHMQIFKCAPIILRMIAPEQTSPKEAV